MMTTRSGHSAASTRHGFMRGFTVVEVLVVIGVLVLLLAIVLPVLSGARAAAWRGEQLANLRQLATAVEIYAQREGGHAPYMNIPGDPSGYDPRLAGLGIQPNSYFRVHMAYYTAPLLADGLITPETLRARAVELRVPDDPRSPRGSMFFLTHALGADPGFWVGESTPNRPEWLRGVRLDRVRFPSRKILIGNHDHSESGPLKFDGRWSVALVDGSARRTTLELTTLGRGLGALHYLGMTTPEGVHGIDLGGDQDSPP